jgi:hypothetical protein
VLNVFPIKNCVCFQTGAFIALTWLSSSHARLITQGETSIEAHINKSEAKRMALMHKVINYSYILLLYTK